MENKNYYETLGLDKNASLEEIEKAYSSAKKALTFDESDSLQIKSERTKQFKNILEAYLVLTKKLKATNEEYTEFKVNVEEIELDKVKIRYWWRFLYIILIFATLALLHYIYPQKVSPQKTIQDTKKETTQKSIDKKVPNKNIKNEQNQSTSEDKKTATENKKQSTSVQSTSISEETKVKTEPKQLKQNTNNVVKTKNSSSKSDFDNASEYFD